MSATKLYTNYAIEFHRLTAEVGAAVYLDGVQSVGLSSGLQTKLETGDGRVAPTFGSLVAGSPRATFSTLDVKGVLDLVPSFAPIDSDPTHPGVTVFGQPFADGGDRSTALAQAATFEAGLLIARGIEASHQGAASISGEIIGKSGDGLVSPVVLDEAATIPAAAAQVDAVWTLGKVDLNGTVWEGIASMSIALGVAEIVEAKDSDIYPTFVSVRETRPTVTLSGTHIDITSLLTEDGLYIPAGVVVYLRKRAEGGTFEPDVSAVHISFTLGKCRAEWGSVQGDPKSLELRLIPWDTEAGAAQLTINTAAAIA